jgi:hypothetical protein
VTCHCFIRHATAPDERAAAAKQLDYSRSVGDTNGILIAIAALSGDCPSRKNSELEEEEENEGR